jgi:membrane protein DedA with SNARE-associated domain
VFDTLTHLVLAAAASPLVYLVLFAMCVVDGFFPPVPSETVLVGLAALAASSGRPVLVAVLAVAAVGAIAGDSVAYWIGRRAGLDRLGRSRRKTVATAFAFASRQLARRPASLILVGRYIPVGRVAVNMTAGATRLPYRRFLALSSLAGLMWSVTSVVIALATASVLHDQPILSAIVSIVVAIAIGMAVDLVVGRVARRREAAGEAAAEEARAASRPVPEREGVLRP